MPEPEGLVVASIRSRAQVARASVGPPAMRSWARAVNSAQGEAVDSVQGEREERRRSLAPTPSPAGLVRAMDLLQRLAGLVMPTTVLPLRPVRILRAA